MSQRRRPPVLVRPTLNSHHPSTVHASAHQYVLPPSLQLPSHGGPSNFSITINFMANFLSSSNPSLLNSTMPGFSASGSAIFPTDYPIHSALSDSLISRHNIPFPLNDIHWEARTHDGHIISTCLLSDEDELRERVADFLTYLGNATCIASQRELSVALNIVKEITLPAEEFAAALRDSALGVNVIRPHIFSPVEGWLDMTEIEEVCYDYEEGDGKDQQCSICLEEFVVGSSVARLPACSHVFHLRCVSKWLERKDDCPLCRTVLPSSVSPYLRFEKEYLPRS